MTVPREAARPVPRETAQPAARETAQPAGSTARAETPPGVAGSDGARPKTRPGLALGRAAREHLPLGVVLGLAAFLRLWQLTAVGFNSDEAVYTGSAAALAGDGTLGGAFPVFRAHPLLFQMLLSLVLRVRDTDWSARAFAAAIGVATVAVAFALGRRLYGRRAGLTAALLLAAMPYHVVVSRQVLLDGLMTLCATTALYCAARYVETCRAAWLAAAAAAMGSAILSKETSIVLIGGLYGFFALTPSARLRAAHLALALGVLAAEVSVWPLMLRWSGHSRTGQSYLLWQMFRRPNHSVWFYFTTLPSWLGPAVLVAAAAGLLWLRREATWRERLLLAWIAVPVLFFTMWPVKGFQYLLPIAPPLAVLAGRTLSTPRLRHAGPTRRLARPAWLPTWRWWPAWRRWPAWPARGARRWQAGPSPSPRAAAVVLTAAAVLSLAIGSWGRIEPSARPVFLAGAGGMNGGRQAGEWIRHHVPAGAALLAIGPSAANVLEFYGRRRIAALSVSPDPRQRNPVYTPVPNPDLALRDGQFQYVVWDAYTAARTSFFASEALRLARKHHGVAVFTSTVSVQAGPAARVPKPVFVIYEVRP